MKRIAAIWAAWVRLLDRREPGLAIALFRIAVGLILLTVLADLTLSGLADVIWLDRQAGGYRAVNPVPHLIRWLGGPTPAVIHGLLYASIAGAALLVAGFGGRITPFVVLQCFLALSRRNEHVSGSVDVVIINGLWLLVLARSTATLSADCWLRTRRLWSDDPIPAFPRYLAILQLIIIYGSTGLSKVSVRWLPIGDLSALYYILQQPTWQRIPMHWAAHIYPLTQAGTLVTWWFEITAPALLLVYYFRATADRGGRLRRWANRFDLRIPWVVTGFLLHALIFATMVVGAFSEIMLAFYICLFHPDELRAAARRLRRARLRRGRPVVIPARSAAAPDP